MRVVGWGGTLGVNWQQAKCVDEHGRTLRQDVYGSPLTFSGGASDTMAMALLRAVYTCLPPPDSPVLAGDAASPSACAVICCMHTSTPSLFFPGEVSSQGPGATAPAMLLTTVAGLPLSPPLLCSLLARRLLKDSAPAMLLTTVAGMLPCRGRRASGSNTQAVVSMEQALPLKSDWLNFNRFRARAEHTMPFGPYRLLLCGKGAGSTTLLFPLLTLIGSPQHCGSCLQPAAAGFPESDHERRVVQVA